MFSVPNWHLTVYSREICSKLTTTTTTKKVERLQFTSFRCLYIIFKHIEHLALKFLLLILGR